MKFLDEFRDPTLVPGLRDRLHRLAGQLAPSTARVTLMEVCGTHTMAIARYGIRELFPANLRMVSGPGCPVCVTPTDYVDHAIALAQRPDTLIATFGDMLRVPGSQRSLAAAKADGARVQVVFSSLDALKLAQRHPKLEVIFLAVGFETTAPTIAATLKAAIAARTRNLSLLCAHKTVPVALQHLATAGHTRLHGLLCPAHVSAIIGTRPYEPLAALGIPCVVGGFEPLDILLAICMLLEQLVSGAARVENEYRRVVSRDGNRRAQAVMDEVFEPCPATWRGLGTLDGSGLCLRPEHKAYDAAARFPVALPPAEEPAGCLCGEILTGAAEPTDCPLFGTSCTPDDPVGACMVSSEGTCAARYRYGADR
jgi:hydrogenase expression/formation protein HypD